MGNMFSYINPVKILQLNTVCQRGTDAVTRFILQLININALKNILIRFNGIPVLIFLVLGCSKQTENKNDTDPIVQTDPANNISEQDAILHEKEKMVGIRNVTINGDFNGDGVKENLKSELYSKRDKQIIREIPEDCELGCICEYDPILYLKSTDSRIPELRLGSSCQIFGIGKLSNIGDVNNDGKDDIAVIVNWASYSGLNTCYLYGLCNGTWLELFSFLISDASLFVDDKYCPDQLDVSEQIFKKDGKYYYYEFELDRDVKKMLKQDQLSGCTVTVSGKITKEMRYGPSNYGESPETDKKEHFYFLNLSKPIDATKYLTEKLDSSYKHITKMQLISYDNFAGFDSLPNKDVCLKGTLFLSHTGHHHTPVLMEVIQITK